MLSRSIASTILLLAYGFLSLSAASAASAVVVKPSSPWTSDYTEESCALVRIFNDADNKVRLELKQYEPDGLMVVSLTGPLRPRESGFRYAFLPDPALREMGPPAHARLSEVGTLTRFTTASLRTISDTNKFYLQMNTPDGNKEFQRLPIWPAEDRNGRFREITGLVLKKAFAQDLTVLIGSMTSPMAAMDKCLDDLITGWGLDAKIEKNLSRRVAMKTFSSPGPNWPKIQSFLTVLKSSHFRVRFMVEGDGTMTSCQVLGAAKGTPEAAALCKAYQDNARFEGALDSNGTPVPSYFMTDMSILGVAL